MNITIDLIKLDEGDNYYIVMYIDKTRYIFYCYKENNNFLIARFTRFYSNFAFNMLLKNKFIEKFNDQYKLTNKFIISVI